jgi:hypothetical protein
LLRAEWELAEALNAKTEKALIDRTLAAVPRAASVVLSDYAKGTLTPRVIREVIDAARKAGIPIIVDPKAVDYSVYRGATVIKPPLLCTLLHGTVKPLDDNVVLYDPRSVEPGTSVVCHIGEGHLGCKARGDIYARIEAVD